MASKTSLKELYRRAVTFPGPSLRVAGLRRALEATEQQLEIAQAQYQLRLAALLKRDGRSMHPDDIEHEKHVVSRLVDELLPKISRGGFVVSLWSVFEACIKDLAEYTKNERKLPFGLQDLRAGDFLEQTDKFFHRVLGLRAFPDKAARKSLEELKSFRNALAHHDGNIREIPKTLLEGGPEGLRKVRVYSDLHHEYAVPSKAYVAEALSLVSAYLEQLAETVYATLHPKQAPTDV